VAGAVLATALVLGIRLLTGGGPMPDLAGLTVDQAEETLGDDVRIEERSALSDGDVVGTIVAQQPGSGAGTPGTVTVTVAEESTLFSLDELGSESATGDLRLSYERVSIDGASTVGAIVSGGFDTDGSTSYELEGGFDRLRGLVGRLDGDGSPTEDSRGERASRGGAGVEVEIYGDDVLLASQVVDVGSPWRLDLDVSGVDELRVPRDRGGARDRAAREPSRAVRLTRKASGARPGRGIRRRGRRDPARAPASGTRSG
jgi:hypothetical protein